MRRHPRRSQEPELALAAYQILFKGAAKPMWVVDAKSLRFLEANQAASDKYGYTHQEFLGMSLVDIRSPEDVPRMANICATLPRGTVNTGHWKHRIKSGEYIDVEVIAHRVKHKGVDAILASIQDISDERRSQADLERISIRNLALLEALPDMIFLMSRDGTFLGFKATREGDLSLPPDQFLGKKISEVLPSAIAETAMKLSLEALKSNTVQTMSYRLPDLAGSMKDFEARLAPCGTEIMIVVRDQTSLKNAVNERDRLFTLEKEARAQAETASRSKDEFLAVLSHELRTSMTAMVGWVWLLKENKDPAALDQALDVLERGLKSQSEIIDDLIDMSRIITGKLHIETCLQAVWPILLNAADVLAPAIKAKSLSLEFSVKDKSIIADVDSGRLQQMAWNLLSNAVKFTPAGGKIQMSLALKNSLVEIKVSDSGEGISREALPHLFERFWQADSTIRRAHNGLGLGLAIVRHLTELHGGSVAAESPGLGHGTSFWIRLPSTAKKTSPSKAARTSAPGPSTPSSAADLKGLSVLVVENDRDILLMLAAVMERFGARVHAAQSCREALSRFKRMRPDILLSALSLPDMDGFQLIRKIRELPADSGGETPAVALTGSGHPEDGPAALKAGFNSYLRKPVEPNELARTLAQLAAK